VNGRSRTWFGQSGIQCRPDLLARLGRNAGGGRRGRRRSCGAAGTAEENGDDRQIHEPSHDASIALRHALLDSSAGHVGSFDACDRRLIEWSPYAASDTPPSTPAPHNRRCHPWWLSPGDDAAIRHVPEETSDESRSDSSGSDSGRGNRNEPLPCAVDRQQLEHAGCHDRRIPTHQTDPVLGYPGFG